MNYSMKYTSGRKTCNIKIKLTMTSDNKAIKQQNSQNLLKLIHLRLCLGISCLCLLIYQ